VGLPGLNGFIGEALCLMGIMEQETHAGRHPVLTFVSATGMVFGAWYMMTMLRRLLFGPVKEPEHHGPPIDDLKVREWIMLAPISVLCLVIGVFPQPILDSAQPDIDRMVLITDAARQRADRPGPATAQGKVERADPE
jgi:NADH-quinone oxidoreductase subunit M